MLLGAAGLSSLPSFPGSRHALVSSLAPADWPLVVPKHFLIYFD